MFTIQSERIQKLRESVLSAEPSVCIERARLVTQAYKDYKGRSVYIKRARALEYTLLNMSIYIKDGELVVGNQASNERTAPVFPEYAVGWMIDELYTVGNFNQRSGDGFNMPKEYKEELLEICNYWKGETLQDRCHYMMPEYLEKEASMKVVHGEGNMTPVDGHIVPDFEKVLHLGLDGVNQEVRVRMAKVDIAENDGLRQMEFLQSIIIVNEAIIKFAQRYAKLAKELAENEQDEIRKKELLEISDICSNVPRKPAQNYKEAIQSTWFTHVVIQIESNGHSASLGRLDQYIYPYYKQDIEKGVITRELAKEYLQCLWIKLFSVIKIRSTSHSGYGAGYPTYQNVTIGGINSDLTDATNDLSMLILDSVGEIKLTQPNLSARVHNNSPEKYLRKCAEVAALGYGMPALHNDEIIIPSLLNRQVDYKDAYNYTMVGCVEVAVPGKWGYRTTGMSFLNMLKVLELTLNNGRDIRTGVDLYTGEGSLLEFDTYQKLWSAFKNNMKYYIKETVVIDKIADTNLLEFPDIFLSALVDDCIGRAKTAKEGGAIYDIVSGLQVGIANVANSLAAMKKLVYEDKEITLEQLDHALKNNFEGVQGMAIRNKLLDAPKYGNDIDYVDDIATDVYNIYLDEIKKYHTTRYGQGSIGGNYSASTSGISSNVPMGAVTGATPDGRLAYTPVAEGGSPAQGTDFEGPTSVLKSVNKLPNILLTGGQLLNIKFSPNLIQNEVGFQKYMMLIKSFIAMKGWHVQFNIVSAETLKKAKETPEEYRDVIVRVAGYCAQFVTLDPTTQDDIISRTEQSF